MVVLVLLSKQQKISPHAAGFLGAVGLSFSA